MKQTEHSRRAAELFKVRVKAARKQAKLTQDELASKADISVVTLSKLESGSNKPAFEIFVALAHALNASPSYLLGWDSDTDMDVDANRRMLIARLGAAVHRLPEEWIEQMISLAELAASKPRR